MKPPRATLLAALAVLALAWVPRWILHDRTPASTGSGWTVSDPDSLYHARRVERLFAEGLPVAAQDAFLNSPHGARIPWPPYYDLLAFGALAPFAPGDVEARRSFVEHGVAWLPLFFGVASSWIAFLAARSLAGTGAGLVAGALHALCLGSIAYSRLGNGDHHAFISLAGAVLLWGLAWALCDERLRSARVSWGLGSCLGALTGIALGSWVAALLLVVAIDLAFAWLLFSHARRPRAGLGAFGLSFHLASFLVLLPAVLESPWKEDFPWMVVNLSWFHLVYLALGALVFLPLAFDGVGERWRRRQPWRVGALLVAVAGFSLLLDAGPVRGIREGIAWVSRQDAFMSGVSESRPLLGSGSLPGELFALLGWQIALLPIVWVAALVVLVRRRRGELLPWVVVVPLFALQAASQARFADALAVPAAVLTGWAAVAAAQRWLPRVPRWLSVTLLVVLALLGQSQTLARMAREGSRPRPDWRRERASRELCEWIATRATPTTRTSGEGGAVLANWNRGHEIEWAARRPSVATNFGSYVGEEGFLAPARFFLALDPARAEALLIERGARFVLHSCSLSSALPGWLAAGDADWRGRFLVQDDVGDGSLLPAWYESVGGQLLNGGFPRVPRGGERADSLDFLRLVHVSPTILRSSPLSSWRGPTPYGWVWEQVAGARVELGGANGELATVEIQLEYRGQSGELLQTLPFLARARVGPDGRAHLRVPYATRAPNGDGLVRGARWAVGERRGSLDIDEDDVRLGRRVVVNN